MKKGLKKTSLAVLATFTLGLLLAGCGGADNAEQGAADGEQTNDKVKAGFIYIGSAKDGGYSQVHDDGRLEMIANIGEDKVETLVREDVPENQTVENVMNEMIDRAQILFLLTAMGFRIM